MRLAPPQTQTLFVDLIRFTPGQPDSIATNGTPRNAPQAPVQPPQAMIPPSADGAPPPQPRAGPSASHAVGPPLSSHSNPHLHHAQLSHSAHPPAHPPHPGHHSPVSGHHQGHRSHSHSHSHSHSSKPSSPVVPYDIVRPPASSSTHGRQVPPPPWTSNRSSPWSTAAVTAPPPTSRTRQTEQTSPNVTPPLTMRKRKYTDDHSPNTEDLPPVASGSASSPQLPSPKRRQTQQAQTTPVMQPSRPSIAMMLSPTPLSISPRQLPPPQLAYPPSRGMTGPVLMTMTTPGGSSNPRGISSSAGAGTVAEVAEISPQSVRGGRTIYRDQRERGSSLGGGSSSEIDRWGPGGSGSTTVGTLPPPGPEPGPSRR